VALDRYRTLEIFERYGVGAKLLAILINFWYRYLGDVTRGVLYHSDAFKILDYRVIQGDTISPTIVYITVDRVMIPWTWDMTNNELATIDAGNVLNEVSVGIYVDSNV
jgi:hypothetical protein